MAEFVNYSVEIRRFDLVGIEDLKLSQSICAYDVSWVQGMVLTAGSKVKFVFPTVWRKEFKLNSKES